MEVLDDIEFLHGTGEPAELLQSKHRGEAGQLSETGKDFWRSVASWIDALRTLGDPHGDAMPLLRLITTQVAAPGSFFSLLRAGPDRDVPRALKLIEAVAQADAPATTADDRKLFLDLTPPQRYRLVDAMKICDAAAVMSDLAPSLAKAMGIRSGPDSDAILDEVKGWWYRVSVELLDRSKTALRRSSVSAQELMCRIEEAADRYAGANLPITEALRRLTRAEIAAYDDRLVVAQMRWIGTSDRAIATFLRDYHHARAQRSEWIRTFKITEEGLEDYERRLWDEWDHVFTRLVDTVGQGSPEEDKHRVGKEVLNQTMDAVADKPARPGSTTAGWIGRGTMHSLADRANTAPEPVGWHPEYDNLLKSSDDDEQDH